MDKINQFRLLLACLVFFIALSVIPWTAYGQSNLLQRPVSITFSGSTVAQALSRLGDRVGYTISFSNSLVDPARQINKVYKDTPLSDILNEVFQHRISDIRVSKGRISVQLTSQNKLTTANTTVIYKVVDTSSIAIETVNVIGRSTLEQVKEQAYNVEVINAKALHHSSLDLAAALNRASGIRVRGAGGIGSDVSVNMNGFSGVQTRFFVDGIPMDTYGSTYQINNIPIETADRIEVYKGVAPVSLAADALGGVINIVTNQSKENHLNVSYSYGSFNTHKSFIDAGYTSRSGLNFSLNAYQNYSDNDYWVNARILDFNTMKLGGYQRVKRFNDGYRNETVIARVGVVDKPYADQLQLGVNLGQEYQDSQSGMDMTFVYGERRRSTKTLTPFLTYSKKDLIAKDLDFRLSSNYNLGYYRFIDTTTLKYNWFGESKDYGTPGEFRYSSAKHYDRDGSVSANFEYTLSSRHTFALSNILTFFNRKGEDPFDYTEESHMLGARKSSLKNMSGLSYRYTHSRDWNTSVFAKSYLQRNEGPINTSTGAQKSYTMSSGKYAYVGYGMATTYFVRRFQFKGSYERTYRLPSTTELFGDESFNAGNINLKPEASHNFNVNVNYDASFNEDHLIELLGSLMYRRTADYIIGSIGGTASAPTTYANHGLVHNKGVNAEIKYIFRQMLTVGGNFTYQDLRFKDKYDVNAYGSKTSLFYNTRVPNMPYVFGNGYINLTLRNLWDRPHILSLGYNMIYVHEFPLNTYFEGTQNVTMVPEQCSHNAFVSYRLDRQRLTFTGEVWNMTDEDVYDNYSLQRPGRSFTVKVGYSMN